MWSSGQNFVGEHLLRTYTAAGVATKTFLPHDVSGGANQSTILIATPQAEAQFGVTADAELPADPRTRPAGPSAGKKSTASPGAASAARATAAAGTPAARRHPRRHGAAAQDHPRLRDPAGARRRHEQQRRRLRSGLPGAAAELGGADRARLRAVAAAGGRRRQGRAPRRRRSRRKPAKKGHDRTPTFRFSSDMASATFECKLDGKPFKACRSPFTHASSASAVTPSRSARCSATAISSTPRRRPSPSGSSRSAARRHAALADVEAFAREAAYVVAEADRGQHHDEHDPDHAALSIVASET